MATVSFPSPFGSMCSPPVVSADPVYRGRSLKAFFSKPKSAESEGSQITFVDLNDISVKCSTPYRLPRIPPPCDTPCTEEDGDKLDGDERVFGRFGYEDVVRMPELGPSITKALINPHSTLAQRYRQASLAVPRFKNAAITPSYRHTPFINDDVDDLDDEYDPHSLFKSIEITNPTGTPVSRSLSPVKSAKSIHWALGNEKNSLFDATGRSRAQGPFSREFTVRCMAPPNWMRMKWGRSRTMVH
ncbi:uncharacterized protein LOC101859086 [Aplysia californica]|uniref:Uncharacterized protein LOC101859086 n=1 Tax=Aplysia californica TaxID=6500 RepID=A0ABM0ZVR9_APLCA|nr:uncharacterized protein LOC101859086 [Aplysia californica]